MFETVVIRNSGDSQRPIDIGLIAETLLFYGNVHLLVHRGTLTELLKAVRPDDLLRALDSKALTMTYARTNLGCMTNTHNDIRFHKYAAFMIGGPGTKRRIGSHAEEIEEVVSRTLGKANHPRRLAKRLLDRISVKNEIGNVSSSAIVRVAEADLQDDAFVTRAVKASLNAMVPGYLPKQPWHFRAVSTNDGYFVDTNLDFAGINREYHKVIPPSHSSVDTALLLSGILDATAEMQIAAEYLAEIVTTPTASAIMRGKFETILRKRDRNAEQIEVFQNVYLGNAKAVRETINSGERTFAEFLALLEQASKFKDWLRGRNPDEALLSEYYKAVTTETWLNKLPTKGVRFFIASALGIAAELALPSGIGMGIGLGLGATDSLLLDKLLKGWRPNQFIDGPLKCFTSP